MLKKLRQIYIRSTLVAKIRFSYVLLVVPLVLFIAIITIQLTKDSREYSSMLQSVMQASRFNLDFKKDFDYETYLLIVGNKTVEESRMEELLQEAGQVVESLKSLDNDTESRRRLESVEKYLDNLKRYQGRIEENLKQEDRYEENIEIWENDIQIVTSLLREEFVAYTYAEVQKLQKSRQIYEGNMKRTLQASLVVFLIIIAGMFWMSYYIPRTITRPIKKLSEVTDLVAKGDLSVRSDIVGGPEVTALGDSMNDMIDRINELLSQVTTEQTRLRKAEFQLLQSQINPHFLYNTLDAIIWLAEAGKHQQVVMMVKSLSDFFRTSLSQGRDIVPLKDEIAHVRSYLQIQQVRYQDIMTYEIDVPSDFLDYMIPKITLQPLVENALYHGIKNRRGGGSIRISTEAEENFFMIEVRDTGAGMAPERLEQVQNAIEHYDTTKDDIYGLYNVNERIRLHFAEQEPEGVHFGITLESRPGEGTVARVSLPYHSEL